MGKVSITKGQVLHRMADSVETVEIVLKGSVAVTDQADITMHMRQGSIIGAFHDAGEKYGYDYIADEDTLLFAYDYSNEEDLVSTLKSNEAILPVIASQSFATVNSILDVLVSVYEESNELYNNLKAGYEDYRDICVKFMTAPKRYDSVEFLMPPDRPSMVGSWQEELCRTYRDKDAQLKKGYYVVDGGLCIGSIMMAGGFARTIHEEIRNAQAYIKATKVRTDDFLKDYYMQKAKLDHANSAEAKATGTGTLPKITNAMDKILTYAGVSTEIAESLKRDIKAFVNAPNQREKSDEMRKLRADIGKNFYAVYEAAFFKSMEVPIIPAEVKMMFLFGFIDEELAGEANTAALYKISLLWEDDPSGNVLTIYDWLKKIYSGEVMPSKNDLDTDWPEHLREQVRYANITQEQADALANDRRAMVHFEITNMVASANRITHGSLFSFIPTFYAGVVTKSLDSCFASPKRVHEAIDKIRDIDFGCFYRPTFTTYPELKINRFDYDVEVLPYVILMPNFGSRGAMWQEIEGRVRTTPSRMMISIFHSVSIEDTMIQLCAQFRWEMCRRIQGVHYSDITDKSLTSEYINYLQFYKKNHELSGEMKDKVKSELQRFHNNYRNVFASDYEMFLKNEANGLPRLTKVAREILFRYCTFSTKYRRALAINPQYQPVIERWKVKVAAKLHAFDLYRRKILTMTDKLPPEVELEAEYMKLFTSNPGQDRV